MAIWTLTCKDCNKAFTYSRIAETLEDYFVPLRPEFPPEGVERECPYCKVRATYQHNELRYSIRISE